MLAQAAGGLYVSEDTASLVGEWERPCGPLWTAGRGSSSVLTLGGLPLGVLEVGARWGLVSHETSVRFKGLPCVGVPGACGGVGWS